MDKIALNDKQKDVIQKYKDGRYSPFFSGEDEQAAMNEVIDMANDLMDELEALKDQAARQEEKYLRLAAEYDNFRKRSQREREQAYTDAVSRAVTALLPTYDNLERALKAETADTEYKKGVELTMTQLTESLKGINVTVIDAAAGTAFDPNFHNAVMHVEDESLGENVIAETFQQGFQIGDKVIRHAMVKVAN